MNPRALVLALRASGLLILVLGIVFAVTVSRPVGIILIVFAALDEVVLITAFARVLARSQARVDGPSGERF